MWCYQHTSLSTFACRAGPFSCRLTLAKLEKKIGLIQAEGCVHIRGRAWLVRVLAVYVWCYQHTTLSTFACRAGSFSCRLTLAQSEKKYKPHSNRDACIHTQLCVACAGVLAVYVWCYQHTTLSTFACRAGPFSCRLALAKSEKKSASFKQRRVHTYAAVRGLCGCSGGLCVVLPAHYPVHFCLPSRPL